MGLRFYFYDFDEDYYYYNVLGNDRPKLKKIEVKPPPLFNKCKSYVERNRDYTNVIFTGINEFFYITFEAEDENGNKINGRFSKNIVGDPIIHID